MTFLPDMFSDFRWLLDAFLIALQLMNILNLGVVAYELFFVREPERRSLRNDYHLVEHLIAKLRLLVTESILQ
jgi:hypothetical protein